jgi:ABC-type multidrug transport system fused ATPase/permease subunit
MSDGDLFASGVRVNFLLALMDQSAMIGMLLVQVLVIGIGIWRAFNGTISIGTLAAFQALCLSVNTSLLYASQYSRDVLPARAGLRRIDEFLAEPDGLADLPSARPARPLGDVLEFSGVYADPRRPHGHRLRRPAHPARRVRRRGRVERSWQEHAGIAATAV